MSVLYLEGVGVFAPGIADWPEARRVLAGEAPLRREPAPRPVASRIPENERRRASDSIHLGVHAADEAVRHAGADPRSLASVFASLGDLKVVDRLCRSLAAPGRPVSPTQFHNSVHNAPAAYWSIATGAPGSSTSLGCWKSGPAAALLSAAAWGVSERSGVLLVAYEAVSPKPFDAEPGVDFPCAIALVLMPDRGAGCLAALDVRLLPGKAPVPPGAEEWAGMAEGNPAAQFLHLLAPVARGVEATVFLDLLEQSHLEVKVQPCG